MSEQRADVAELLIALLTLTLLIPYYLEAITKFVFSKNLFEAFQNLLIADILLITMTLFYEPFYHYLKESDARLTSAIFAVLLILSGLVLIEWAVAMVVPDNFANELLKKRMDVACLEMLPLCTINAMALTGVAYIMSYAYGSRRSKAFYVLSFIASMAILAFIFVMAHLMF